MPGAVFTGLVTGVLVTTFCCGVVVAALGEFSGAPTGISQRWLGWPCAGFMPAEVATTAFPVAVGAVSVLLITGGVMACGWPVVTGNTVLPFPTVTGCGMPAGTNGCIAAGVPVLTVVFGNRLSGTAMLASKSSFFELLQETSRLPIKAATNILFIIYFICMS